MQCKAQQCPSSVAQWVHHRSWWRCLGEVQLCLAGAARASHGQHCWVVARSRVARCSCTLSHPAVWWPSGSAPCRAGSSRCSSARQPVRAPRTTTCTQGYIRIRSFRFASTKPKQPAALRLIGSSLSGLPAAGGPHLPSEPRPLDGPQGQAFRACRAWAGPGQGLGPLWA